MNNSLVTPEMLAEIFRTGIAKQEPKPEDLKWVIYLRKSTDETGKQIRSIDDQKKECLEYARRNKLTIDGNPLKKKDPLKNVSNSAPPVGLSRGKISSPTYPEHVK